MSTEIYPLGLGGVSGGRGAPHCVTHVCRTVVSDNVCPRSSPMDFELREEGNGARRAPMRVGLLQGGDRGWGRALAADRETPPRAMWRTVHADEHGPRGS